jgi:hypothetical protein
MAPCLSLYTPRVFLHVKVLLRFIFNVHGSAHRNNILVYKSPQDAHVTEFILSDNCSTYIFKNPNSCTLLSNTLFKTQSLL